MDNSLPVLKINHTAQGHQKKEPNDLEAESCVPSDLTGINSKQAIAVSR